MGNQSQQYVSQRGQLRVPTELRVPQTVHQPHSVWNYATTGTSAQSMPLMQPTAQLEWGSQSNRGPTPPPEAGGFHSSPLQAPDTYGHGRAFSSPPVEDMGFKNFNVGFAQQQQPLAPPQQPHATVHAQAPPVPTQRAAHGLGGAPAGPAQSPSNQPPSSPHSSLWSGQWTLGGSGGLRTEW